ncbi:hypothetical protein [Ruegeria profundi]|uniref:hypothetical protein n=1 Tax=Ruegeria profundi TaxID=1685378 RepID=UPI001CD31312|nr:hypothetical protein [Ruegeria profundi]MCA0927140.1 hypothetical protein [Ruegeria profundi]
MRLTARATSIYLYEKHGLQYAPKTLANMRSDGAGPLFSKLRGRIYYESEDVDAWVLENLSDKTAWSGKETS